MFASIVNFDEFFQMSSDYDKQIQCLRLLNEIIGDIDMVRDTDMVIRAASGLPDLQQNSMPINKKLW